MRCLVRPRNGRWTIAAIVPWTTTIGGSVHSTATLPWYPATTSTPTRPAMLSQRYRSLLSSAVQSRLHAMLERHREILAELQSSNSSSGSGAYTSQSTAKELQSLAGLTSLYETYMGLEDEKKSYQDLQKEATSTDNTDDDDDLAEECASELDRIAKAREVLETKLIDALLQSEDDDDAHDATSDAILEIRAGTGGDEAALFAGELWDAYAEAARANRWKVDVLSVSRTDLGGVKAGTLSISGRPTMRLPDDVDETGPVFAPYGAFKYESGVHRVQRVPVNDNKLQTSACSIAVLPDLNDAAVGALAMSDLKIDTMRSSGAGGQHVNTTDSAVRMTHLPTGITVSMQDERSQHQNREKALKVITARVRDHERTLAMEKSGASRSSLMGAGDRSERIRTFNFPQDRISDHRCKETRHGIAALLKGGRDSENLVSAFLPHLRSMRRQEQLEVLEEKHIAKVNKK